MYIYNNSQNFTFNIRDTFLFLHIHNSLCLVSCYCSKIKLQQPLSIIYQFFDLIQSIKKIEMLFNQVTAVSLSLSYLVDSMDTHLSGSQ